MILARCNTGERQWKQKVEQNSVTITYHLTKRPETNINIERPDHCSTQRKGMW